MPAPIASDNDPQKLDRAATESYEESTQYDPNYVPEREFVLMPLFRRIGKMLGIRRHDEQQYVYESQPVANAADSTSSQGLQTEPEYESDEQAMPSSAPPHEQYEDVLDIESEAPAAEVVSSTMETVAEVPGSAHQRETQFHESLPGEEPAASFDAPFEAIPENAWESQIVGGENNRPAAHIDQVPELPLEAHALIANIPADLPVAEAEAPAWEPEVTSMPQPEAPALQREMAWNEHAAAGQASPATNDLEYQRPQIAGARPRPQLVPTVKRVPIWKQVQWAREFTPKRVAFLGGVAMAVLIVAGISAARRPASAVLPEQQQTRALSPGGVTVSTRPTKAVRPQITRERPTATPKPAAGQHRSHRAATREEDGPEVVTHYYNHAKTSPVRQSTVAGVKHYSDME